LDLYFKHNPLRISKSHPEVVALSKVLRVAYPRRHRMSRSHPWLMAMPAAAVTEPDSV
jgi:hypothetical protein